MVDPARLYGFLWVVTSATGFGAMPVFAKYAYSGGVDLPSMLFLRFSFAGIVLAIWVFLKRGAWPRRKNLPILMAMGALGYVGQSFCYFGALQHASAALTALLLYLNPVIVTLLSALITRTKLPRHRVVAVTMALLGTALAVGQGVTGGPVGVALGLGAALVYSLYILAGEKVMATEEAVPSAAVVMLSAAMVYGVIVLLRGGAFPSSVVAWGAVSGLAFFSTLLAIVGILIGVRFLGASSAATISTLEPVVTIVLAAFFLGEKINLLQVVGGALILGAVVILVRGSPPRPCAVISTS